MNMATKRFLHIGCGAKDKRQAMGFAGSDWAEVRFDVDPTVNPDIVGDIVDMSMIGAETLDGVYASHVLEHLYSHQVMTALGECARILKPTGFAIFTCPDLQAVGEQLAKGNLVEPMYVAPAGPIAPIDMLFGLRSSLKQGNDSMAHRTGFTAKVLGGLLSGAGFQKVAATRRGRPYYDLWAVATKAPASNADLQALVDRHWPAACR